MLSFVIYKDNVTAVTLSVLNEYGNVATIKGQM